jgi:hypothetical protein
MKGCGSKRLDHAIEAWRDRETSVWAAIDAASRTQSMRNEVCAGAMLRE